MMAMVEVGVEIRLVRLNTLLLCQSSYSLVVETSGEAGYTRSPFASPASHPLSSGTVFRGCSTGVLSEICTFNVGELLCDVPPILIAETYGDMHTIIGHDDGGGTGRCRNWTRAPHSMRCVASSYSFVVPVDAFNVHIASLSPPQLEFSDIFKGRFLVFFHPPVIHVVRRSIILSPPWLSPPSITHADWYMFYHQRGCYRYRVRFGIKAAQKPKRAFFASSAKKTVIIRQESSPRRVPLPPWRRDGSGLLFCRLPSKIHGVYVYLLCPLQ